MDDLALRSPPAAEGKPFAVMEEALGLFKSRRKNSAASSWNKLPVPFRIAVTGFAMGLLQDAHCLVIPEPWYCFTFKTEWGHVTFAKGPPREGIDTDHIPLEGVASLSDFGHRPGDPRPKDAVWIELKDLALLPSLITHAS